ncbi:WD40 repeat domain-containing protein [Nocardia sp. NPDC056064]|uniref:WD40 repeat domain-containing protein n=1 Tax=Nocardia sp. NPDC056064 TaxID=3345701 RepID=UPI0035D6482C
MQIDERDRPFSAGQLARAGCVAALRVRMGAGDEYAGWYLAVALRRAGRIDELRERMAAGDRSARRQYSDWLVRQRRIPEAIEVLRPLAESGIRGARRRLARLLGGQGRYAEAVSVLAQVPPHWDDVSRVSGWLCSHGLIEPEHTHGRPITVPAGYLDALRRNTVAGDADARQQLSWIVLLWWRRSRLGDSIALLRDIGPSDWLHQRLVWTSDSWYFGEFRSEAIDALAMPEAAAYHRTRAALLILQGERDAAITQLRSRAADGDEDARADLARLLAEERPQREIRFVCHPTPIHLTGMAFSPDGSSLAAWGPDAGSRDRAVVWDVASGAQRRVQKLSSLWLDGVDFRPDGTLDERPGQPAWRHRSVTAPDDSVIAVHAHGRLRLRSIITGKIILEIPTPRGTVVMAFSPDSAVVATGVGGTGVDLWNTTTGELLRTIATTTHVLAFHPDGTMLATGDSSEGAIRLWRLAEQAPEKQITPPAGSRRTG